MDGGTSWVNVVDCDFTKPPPSSMPLIKVTAFGLAVRKPGDWLFHSLSWPTIAVFGALPLVLVAVVLLFPRRRRP